MSALGLASPAGAGSPGPWGVTLTIGWPAEGALVVLSDRKGFSGSEGRGWGKSKKLPTEHWLLLTSAGFKTADLTGDGPGAGTGGGGGNVPFGTNSHQFLTSVEVMLEAMLGRLSAFALSSSLYKYL